MTPTIAAAASVDRLNKAISDAQMDVVLYARLRDAETRLKRLTGERLTAVSLRDSLALSEAKAAAATRFATFGDIKVTDRTPNESALNSSYSITYSRKSHDPYANDNVPKSTTVTGFASLPPLVLEYLIVKKPAAIPAKIAALAANPEDAFKRYFMGLRRGFLSS